MSIGFHLVMVGSAPSMSQAIQSILDRLGSIGHTLWSSVHEGRSGEREARLSRPGWEAEVDPWTTLNCSVYLKGPALGLFLEKIGDEKICVWAHMTRGTMETYLAQEGSLDRVFFEPLLQIALALGARAGAGTIDPDFQPVSGEDIERAIRVGLQAGMHADLAFLRRDPGTPPPGPPHVIRERPEGYWILEDPEYLEDLKP